MRRLFLCCALLGLFAAGPLAANEVPVHDCLEGGSMDYTPLDAATQTPVPSTGS